MPETVPSEICNTSFATTSVKPFPWSLQLVSSEVAMARFRGNHHMPCAIAPLAQRQERIHCCVIEGHISNPAMLAQRNGDLTAEKVNTVPRQAVLLAKAHPCMKRQLKGWQLAGVLRGDLTLECQFLI